MTNETVIMDKEDYHKILDIITTLNKITDAMGIDGYSIQGGLMDLTELPDKAETFDVESYMLIRTSDISKIATRGEQLRQGVVANFEKIGCEIQAHASKAVECNIMPNYIINHEKEDE